MAAFTGTAFWSCTIAHAFTIRALKACLFHKSLHQFAGGLTIAGLDSCTDICCVKSHLIKFVKQF